MSIPPKRNFRHCSRQTLRPEWYLPPSIMPSHNTPFPWVWETPVTCLILTKRVQQKWRDTTSMIMLHKIVNWHLASRFSLLTLSLVDFGRFSYRDLYGKKPWAAPSQQPARDWGPQSSNLQGTGSSCNYMRLEVEAFTIEASEKISAYWHHNCS